MTAEATAAGADLGAARPLPAALRCGVIVLWLAVGFVMGCAALGTIIPRREPVSAKLEYFREHAREYNVLFLGSSRVHHGLDPQLFDRLMGESGHAVKSFNFGIDGMYPPESFYVLRRLLAQPGGIRWVVMELMPAQGNAYLGDNARTERAEYWHDARSVRMIWRLFAERRALWRNRATMGMHLWLWAQRASASGVGARWLAELKERDEGERDEKRFRATKGYGPGGEQALQGEEKERFEKEVNELREQGRKAPAESRAMADELRELTALAREKGAQPVLFYPPTTNGAERIDAAGAAPVLDFGEVREFPELLEARYYYDPIHFNPGGAKEWTGAMAQAFARLLEHGANRREERATQGTLSP